LRLPMEFEVGQILQGEVVAIKPYGAFIRFPDGAIGMIHISEIAEEYVSDINEYLAVGEEVTVKVIGKNFEGKPNLSLKRLTKEELEEVRFSREVEEARLALEKRNDEVLARLKRLKRAKSAPQEEMLWGWIVEAERLLRRARAGFSRSGQGQSQGQGRGPSRRQRRETE